MNKERKFHLIKMARIFRAVFKSLKKYYLGFLIGALPAAAGL